jgi:hypothetical protein
MLLLEQREGSGGVGGGGELCVPLLLFKTPRVKIKNLRNTSVKEKKYGLKKAPT